MWVIELLGLDEELQLPLSGRQEAKQKGGVQSTLARPQGEGCMTDGPGPDTGHKGAGPLLRLHMGWCDCQGGKRVSSSFTVWGQVREFLPAGWGHGTADPVFGGHRAPPAVRSMPLKKCQHLLTTLSPSSSSPLRLREVSGEGDGGIGSQLGPGRTDALPLLTP